MPESVDDEVELRRGARRIIMLFLLTIATAVAFENILHLPAVMGMMMGMAYLQFFGYHLKPATEKTGAEQGDELQTRLANDAPMIVAVAQVQ